MGMAAKAKDKDAKSRYKHIAKNTLELARAAARRMQITAENAADSYARSIKKAAEDAPVTKPAKKEAILFSPSPWPRLLRILNRMTPE